jgi:hypothetical protein
VSLEIIAYERLELVRAVSIDGGSDETLAAVEAQHAKFAKQDRSIIYIHNLPDFRPWSDGMPDWFYRASDERFAVWNGPARAYNHWRVQLAKLVGLEIVPASEAFGDDLDPEVRELLAAADVEWYRGTAESLGAILHFNDAEGFLGPDACALVATQLDELRPRAASFAEKLPADERAFLSDAYDRFSKAVKLARHHGALAFG